MNGPTRFVGRFASMLLAEDGSAPGTAHVEVCSYDSHDRIYEVKIIDNGQIARVQFSDLQFYSPDDFMTRFPQANTCVGSHTMATVPGDSVIDFSSVHGPSSTGGPSLFIRNSCRIVGNSTNKTTFSKGVTVHTQRSSDIVEFEHISFEFSGKAEQEIACRRGIVVFRNCAFSHSRCGVMIACGPEDYVHAFFETCTFIGHKECALKTESSNVLMVNCLISDVGMAAVVKGDTHLSAFYSVFKSCVGALVASCGGEVRLFGCRLLNTTDFAVLASNGSKVSLAKCIINQCTGDGIVVEGGSYTAAIIETCKISSCRSGVRVGNGKVNVAL